MQAVILAGGKGTRLKPYTTNFPKPLMPIGDKPILEILLTQLKSYGFKEIVIAVNHLADLIIAFLGHGEKLGLNIRYSMEDMPLGTAGPLRQIPDLDDNFLVMNGDLLTSLNYKDLYDTHVKNKNDATINVYKKSIKIDLGVIERTGSTFNNYIEKPNYSFDVSTGIYIFNKSVIDQIPVNEKYDMPSFILDLKNKHHKVYCYSVEHLWLDIGRVDDYESATELFENNKNLFFNE